MARRAQRALSAAGARVTYREIDDLSHTYPREVNAELPDMDGRRTRLGAPDALASRVVTQTYCGSLGARMTIVQKPGELLAQASSRHARP